MALPINLIATDKVSIKLVRHFSITTETRKDPSDSLREAEQWRQVIRVILTQDASNIISAVNLDSGLFLTQTIKGSFNGGPELEITAGYNFGFWRLMSQEYDEYEQQGSLFFRATLEYVSVTPWATLDWTAEE